MEDTFKTKENKMKIIKKSPIGSKDYKDREDQRYYYLERTFIKPLLFRSSGFKHYSEQLKGYKQPLNGLRKVFSQFILQHGLEFVKIKKTNRKDLGSHYCSESQTISINAFDLNNFKKDPSDKNVFELIFIFIHELAHSYVLNYCNDFSHHDAFYFNFVTKMYSCISNVPVDSFLHNKIGSRESDEVSLFDVLEYDRHYFYSADLLCIESFDKLEDAKKSIDNKFKTFTNYNQDVVSDLVLSCTMREHLYCVDFLKNNDTVESVRCLVFEYNNQFNLIIANYELFYTSQEKQEQKYLIKDYLWK